MHRSLSHLGDRELLRDLAAAVARERISTAEVLLLIAEVDARRLFLPAAYPCMKDYCVGALGLSEEAAFKRIRVARLGREHPEIFESIEDGRLTLSSVLLLKPHLTRANAVALLDAASHKTRAELERMLAERFPGTEELALVEAVPSSPSGPLAPGPVGGPAPTRVGALESRRAPGRVELNGGSVAIAPDRYAVHVTIGKATQEKLERVRSLLSHAVPSGDLGEVLDRALDALLEKLEKRKKAVTSKPCAPRGASSPRSIPAHVRRAVFERDGDQCTFVSENGWRCEARDFLELDHIEPVAGGGASTLANLRVRCRAHNQMAADQLFGAEFMRRRREQRRAGKSKDEITVANAPGTRTAKAPATVVDIENEKSAEDLVPWLRALGYRPEIARDAAARCGTVPGESLEDRVKRALSLLRLRVRHTPAPTCAVC